MLRGRGVQRQHVSRPASNLRVQGPDRTRLTLDQGTRKRPAQSRDFLPIRGLNCRTRGLNLTCSGSSRRRAGTPCSQSTGSATCRRPAALRHPVLASQIPGGWSCLASRAASGCLICRSNLPGCGIHTLSGLTRTISPRSPSSQRSREYPFTEHSKNDTRRVKPQAVLMLSSLP